MQKARCRRFLGTSGNDPELSRGLGGRPGLVLVWQNSRPRCEVTNGAGAVFFSACPDRSQSVNRAWMSLPFAGPAPLVPKHAIAVRRSRDPAGDTRRHEAEQQKMTSYSTNAWAVCS
jgi:hypothetical protein